MLELVYYLLLNLLVLMPLIYLLKLRLIIDYPLIVYLLSIWLFLILGIPFSKDLVIYGSYTSFSYSLNYFLVIVALCLPVYILLLVKKNYRKYAKNNSFNFLFVKTFFYIFWFISIIGCAIYVYKIGLPPLFKSFSISGNSNLIYALRLEDTYNDNFRFFNMFFTFFPVVAGLLGHVLFLNKRISLVLYLMSFILVLILSFSFLHKSYMVMFIIYVVFLSILINMKYKKYLPLAFVVSLIFFILSYVFYMSERLSDILIIIKFIGDRIYLPYLVTLDFSLENFPNKYDFFYGATFPNPKGIFNFEPIYLSNFMMNTIAGKEIGTLPVSSIGFLYVNFGFFGVILYILFLTTFFIFLYKIYENEKNILVIIIWSLFTVNLYKLAVQDPFSILDYKLFLLLIVFYITIFLRRRRNCIEKSNFNSNK